MNLRIALWAVAAALLAAPAAAQSIKLPETRTWTASDAAATYRLRAWSSPSSSIRLVANASESSTGTRRPASPLFSTRRNASMSLAGASCRLPLPSPSAKARLTCVSLPKSTLLIQLANEPYQLGR